MCKIPWDPENLGLRWFKGGFKFGEGSDMKNGSHLVPLKQVKKVADRGPGSSDLCNPQNSVYPNPNSNKDIQAFSTRMNSHHTPSPGPRPHRKRSGACVRAMSAQIYVSRMSCAMQPRRRLGASQPSASLLCLVACCNTSFLPLAQGQNTVRVPQPFAFD